MRKSNYISSLTKKRKMWNGKNFRVEEIFKIVKDYKNIEFFINLKVSNSKIQPPI